MYGKMVNGKIVYAPENYVISDGLSIIGFNTSEELMRKYGYKEIVEHNTDYDPVTEELYISNIQESTTVIDIYYSARNKATFIEVNSGDVYTRDETYDRATINEMIDTLTSAIIDLKFNQDNIEVILSDVVRREELLNVYATQESVDRLKNTISDYTIIFSKEAIIAKSDINGNIIG